MNKITFDDKVCKIKIYLKNYLLYFIYYKIDNECLLYDYYYHNKLTFVAKKLIYWGKILDIRSFSFRDPSIMAGVIIALYQVILLSQNILMFMEILFRFLLFSMTIYYVVNVPIPKQNFFLEYIIYDCLLRYIKKIEFWTSHLWISI